MGQHADDLMEAEALYPDLFEEDADSALQAYYSDLIDAEEYPPMPAKKKKKRKKRKKKGKKS